MKIFNLPDLGEGLPDAEIVTWHVNIGDKVAIDQALVSVETAKAIVEVPSPNAGTIAKLYGKAGDIIKTGTPLVAFTDAKIEDAGTVVGKIATSDTLETEQFKVATHQTIIATPSVRALARKLDIDLNTIKPTGPNGVITEADLQIPKANFKPLRGTRRTMAIAMTTAHQAVVPVTLYDDADIDLWQKDEDITVRVIRAMIHAQAAAPMLNAHYDPHTIARRDFSDMHLGLAMDTEDGLFVPVIPSVQDLTPAQIRAAIETYRQTVSDRTIAPDHLQGATITLSNFGKWAGRYASPIVMPPTVAIIGVGKLYNGVVAADGGPAVHRILPISLSFDHRAITGGEAAKFLASLLEHLSQHKN